MPTRNGLVTPTELADEELKKRGIEGIIHPRTGLMLPICEETRALVAKEMLGEAAREILPRNNSRAKSRRTRR